MAWKETARLKLTTPSDALAAPEPEPTPEATPEPEPVPEAAPQKQAELDLGAAPAPAKPPRKPRAPRKKKPVA